VLPSPHLWCRHSYSGRVAKATLHVKVAVRVLIVDDRAPFRRAARAVIDASEGFEAIGEASSGEEAVLAAGLLRPDLVLMDVNLPGINGLEATRSILDGADHRVVILLLSTYEESEFGPRIAESGAAGFISKSAFEPDGLREAWERATSAV
jgi:DNA-binding NarL/FixJ family response regulator